MATLLAALPAQEWLPAPEEGYVFLDRCPFTGQHYVTNTFTQECVVVQVGSDSFEIGFDENGMGGFLYDAALEDFSLHVLAGFPLFPTTNSISSSPRSP